MSRTSTPLWLRYALAFLIVGLAAALRAGLQRAVGGGLPFVTFFPAVLLVALYAGVGPGLLAIGLSALAASFWFEPIGRPYALRAPDQVGLALFAVFNLLVVWVCERLRRAHGRAAVATAAQTRLAAIVETSDDAIISKSLEGVIQSWNASAERMFGYTAAEAVGGSVMMLIPPDRTAEEEGVLAAIRRGELIDHYETLRRRKDGTPVEVSVTISPLRDERGVVTGASTIIRSVAERRRAEREVMAAKASADRSLAQLRAVVGSMSEGLMVADAAGKMLDWNDAALRMHGFATFAEADRHLSEFPGTFELRRADGSRIELPDWPMSRALRGESFTNLEARVVRAATGVERVISYSGTSVREAGEGGAPGAVSLALLTLHDVTEERRAQAALREGEARLQLAVAIAQMGTFDIDLRTDAVTVNEPGREMYGWAPGEPLTFTKVQGHFHPDDRDEVMSRVGDALSPSGPGQFELEQRIIRTDGAVRWIRVRGRAILGDTGGGLAAVRCVGTYLDVTRQQEAQQERERLLAAERAARADAERNSRLKDEFLATLSHELRTPLNAILGWAHLLRSGPAAAGRADRELAEGLDTIERNARAQTRIVEDLLDMSRIINGTIRLDVQRVDLAGVVEAAVDTVRHAADAKGVRLHVVLDPLTGPVSGDPHRLQQVFWNLLSNAVKFSGRGGQVQVLLERVNSHLEVSVVDRGEGIRPEFLPHVFDRFRQADASTTRRHGGLGLGLSIVKQLVELHGGTVRAKSAGEGQGATFIVMLPLSPVHDGPQRASERRHPRGGADLPPASREECPSLDGLTVLVVDDEPDGRSLVRRVLEDCGATVVTAGSAAEALDALRRRRPDVMVSDIGMAGEDGYGLIARVRAMEAEAGGGVPAVALTAYARAEDRRKVLLAGYQMHVAKPVEPAELVTVVASLAGRTGIAQGAPGGET